MLKKKNIFALLLSVVMLVSLAACGGDKKPATDGAAVEGDTIVIGGIGPLTGAVSIYGKPSLDGARLYLEQKGEVLGKKIVFETLDDKGDTTEAVTQFNKLINNNKAVAIIGPITSKPASAVAIESQNSKIPMISPSATAEDVTTYGDNVFRTCYLDPFQSETMARFASESLNLKNVAILYDQSDDYSSGVAEAFVTQFEARGGKIVANEAFSSGDQDFKTQITNIQKEAPDGLFLPFYYEDLAMFAKQASDAGLDVQKLGVDGWDGVLDVVDDASILEGSYFCNHYSPDDNSDKVQNFLKDYKERFGSDPNAFSALGYDSAKLLIAAIEKAGSTESEAITKAMKEISVDGVTAAGEITFDEGGNPIKGVSIIKIEDGKNILFEKLDVQ